MVPDWANLPFAERNQIWLDYNGLSVSEGGQAERRVGFAVSFGSE